MHGIRELNTPLPHWWLWVFYATIIWSIGYWIVYPSWPLIFSYTTGVFCWQSRAAARRRPRLHSGPCAAPMTEKLAATALPPTLKSDQALADFTYAQGRAPLPRELRTVPRRGRRRRQGLSEPERQ